MGISVGANPGKSRFIVVCFVRFGGLGIGFAGLFLGRRRYLAVALRVQGNPGKSRFIQPNRVPPPPRPFDGLSVARNCRITTARLEQRCAGSCAEAYGTAGVLAAVQAAGSTFSGLSIPTTSRFDALRLLKALSLSKGTSAGTLAPERLGRIRAAR